MRKHVIGLICLFASLAPAVAQMTVDVSLGQEQYLSGEAVTAVVRVTNLSGRSIRLGADNEWLTFSIDGRENLVVRQFGDVPVTGEFVLENSQRATKRVNIAPYFSIGEPGHYRITATVRVKEWGFEASSVPAGFNVIEGAKLWEREFGVPSSGTNGAPEIRKYILQQANYLRNGLALFLRVTDASGGKSYRVAPIGGLLSFSRPEAQVDRLSRLHVLYQNAPHSFGYFVFDTDGDLLVRQTHDYANTRPRLQGTEDGDVSVVGGVRRLAATDLPPLKPASTPDAPPTSPTTHPDASPKS